MQVTAFTALRTLALISPPLQPLARQPMMVRMMSGFNGPRQQELTQKLTDAFKPAHLEVVNTSHGRAEDESHFKVVVVSDVFEGKRLLGRHQAVNKAVMAEDGSLGFHSLEIGAAKTPAEWGVDSAVPDSPRCMGGDGSGMSR